MRMLRLQHEVGVLVEERVGLEALLQVEVMVELDCYGLS